MKPIKSRRFARLACPASVCASIALIFSAFPASATSLTNLDQAELSKIVGFGNGHGYTNQDYWNYCKAAGFGTGWGQCAISGYIEEERTAEDPDWHSQVRHIPNCGDSDLRYMDMQTYSHSTTNSLGTSAGVAYNFEFDEAPLGVGSLQNLSFGIETSFTSSWSHEETTSQGWSFDIPDNSWGDVYYYTYHGSSHGLAQVQIIGAMKPNVHQFGSRILYPRPSATVSIPMDLTGDLPAPLDSEQAARQTTTGFLTKTPPMTAWERKTACGE
ncbi:hypothetical protein AB0N17_45510 [Streptomyces sp. NPDC051133]|uniref:hypothetical protein n=1 Tax=Streptomyces sp. NPDC051133 TaxID=3155521 RepID=UPI003447B2D2